MLHISRCSSRLLIFYLVHLFLTGKSTITDATIILSVTPESRNVSEGKMVEFYCATPDSGVFFSWNTMPSVGQHFITDTDLPGGGKHSVLSFIATAQHNNTIVRCVATKNTSSVVNSALLLVQGLLSPVGDLNSTVMDHCTLHFTWTAPYTLQGVPINYYNITITGHSDGAVSGSYTTNTTEFLYRVSRLGETLEVVVAAVNDVGMGGTSNSSAAVTKLPFTLRCHKRSNNNWTYTFHIKGICSHAFLGIIVQKCSDGNDCTNTTGNMDTSDGEWRVNATFTNLTENRMYSASALVHYDGGVMHRSQSADVDTFDVQNVTKPSVLNGQICFNISYVKGHETPPRCFVRLTCGTLNYTQMINGTSGCINNVLPHESCNLTVTDGDDDAVHNINTAAPVTITGISVPSYTVAPSTTSTTPTTTPTDPPTGISDSPSTKPILVLIAVPIAGGVLLVVVIIIIIIIIIVVVGLFYLYKRNRVGSEMKPQPEQLSKFQITSSDVTVPLESPTTGNWTTTEEVQNEATTPTQESSYAPSSTQPPADYPPPTKPPNIACDEAATSTQECDYAVVGATRPSDHPYQPPPADTRVVYSDVSATSFSTAC